MNYPKARIIGATKPGETDVIDLPISHLIEQNGVLLGALMGKGYIQTRCGGELSGRGLFLSSKYDWVVVKDTNNDLVLVPLLRQL